MFHTADSVIIHPCLLGKPDIYLMNLPACINNMVLLQFDIRTFSKIGATDPKQYQSLSQMFKSIGSAQSTIQLLLGFFVKKSLKIIWYMLATWPNSYIMERYLISLPGRMKQQKLTCKIKLIIITEIETTLFWYNILNTLKIYSHFLWLIIPHLAKSENGPVNNNYL